jgi:hypothetical protein
MTIIEALAAIISVLSSIRQKGRDYRCPFLFSSRISINSLTIDAAVGPEPDSPPVRAYRPPDAVSKQTPF